MFSTSPPKTPRDAESEPGREMPTLVTHNSIGAATVRERSLHTALHPQPVDSPRAAWLRWRVLLSPESSHPAIPNEPKKSNLFNIASNQSSPAPSRDAQSAVLLVYSSSARTSGRSSSSLRQGQVFGRAYSFTESPATIHYRRRPLFDIVDSIPTVRIHRYNARKEGVW
jgi:hypothetical protein